MSLKTILATFLLGMLLVNVAHAQTASIKEYLNVAGPISFGKRVFNLVWTSHPSGNYYKQEYLPKGETVEKFKTLILFEAVVGTLELKDVVAAKVAELKKLKTTNPVINYESFEKDGEVMLDFLMSEDTPDGKYLSVVERNVYRYKSFTDKNGRQGVLLFGVSERAYGDDIEKFFKRLKAHRYDLINDVGEMNIPDITIVE